MPVRRNGKAISFVTKSGVEITGDISVQSIVKAAFAVLAILVGVVLVVFLQRVIVLFLLALLLAAVMDPGVKFLRKWKISTSLAVLVHYTIFLAVAVYLVSSLIPIIAEQLVSIIRLAQAETTTLLSERRIEIPFLSPDMNVRLTMLLRLTLRNLSLEGREGIESLNTYLSGMTANSLQFLATLAGSALGFLWNAFLVMLFAFFIQIERGRVYYWFRRFMPASTWEYVDEKFVMISEKLGLWIRGQLLLCLAIGSLTFVILLILGIPYALTLAILAGFLEFVPYIGPLLAAIPAVMIAMAESGFMWACVVAGAYYVIQFTENNVLVPLIMKRTVEISAVAIMTAMLIGVSFPSIIHPVLGILISIPTASIAGIFLEDVRRWQRGRTAATA